MARDTDIVTEMALAEASAWLTQLHGAERSPATDAAFREWLEADSAHAAAFARVTDVWDVLPGAVTYQEIEPRVGRRWGLAVAMAASLLLAIGIGGYAFRSTNPVYDTPRGQQRSLALADGSHIALNTDSSVEVDYSDKERRVRLDRGEVLFKVAKNAERPFIVEAGDEEVRAIGTSFVVRRDAGGKVAVTLIEGVVKVTRKPMETRTAPMPPAVLRAGERLTISPTQVALDRPRLEAVTAWRSGNVMFDDQPLSDAVAEINRYGTTQIVLADPRLGNLRISGVFGADAPRQFAELTASVHGLSVVREDDRIILKRP